MCTEPPKSTEVARDLQQYKYLVKLNGIDWEALFPVGGRRLVSLTQESGFVDLFNEPSIQPVSFHFMNYIWIVPNHEW